MWGFNWITDVYDNRRRSMDIKFMWPCACDVTESPAEARSLFASQVSEKTSWRRHYTRAEIRHIIDKLEVIDG